MHEYRLGVGMVTRPVPTPDNVDDDLNIPKDSGKVALPLHVRWSPPFDRIYYLTDLAARSRMVCKQVLTESDIVISVDEPPVRIGAS